ncbi:MAG: apolipoprotein N-acyltransferase [Cytophagales bacterium]|nr:apolipoprotein N-acyltransferase [Cytophagales bacterium]MCA6368843.1 apolipoprotein N-acyltransferase [Cytophagales bacterium]MCA6372081.1 apolipoprotein N-acyltransferase [Cytophagales bacterium]MCA6378064.1 apolipoprotein N-acyltransferase [Cytophagales bacterium]MCA6386136.1 apolipoprotein N-acyltransferase [Cytophagales bacterium]
MIPYQVKRAGINALLFLLTTYLIWIRDLYPLIFIFSAIFFAILNDLKNTHAAIAIICSFFLFLSLNFQATHWLLDTKYGEKALQVYLANSVLMTVPVTIWYLGNKYLKFSLFHFIPIWTAFEFVHLHWSLSWPWLTLGHTLSRVPSIIQWYEYTGVLGGTIWILLVGICLFRFYSDRVKFKNNIVFACLLSMPLVLSFILKREEKTEGSLKVTIVQPNLSHDYSSNTSRINTLIKNLKNNVPRETSYILLPEYTLNDSIYTDDIKKCFEVKILQNYLRTNLKSGTRIILGLELLESNPNESIIKKFNALAEIDSSGLRSLYFKNKYIPFQEVIPKGFEFLGFTSANYSLAKNSSIDFENQNNNFLPILAICYESIYGEYLSLQSTKKPSAIFMFSNEGFLNQSKGKDQYFSFIRLRAIELRKEIARTSNLGYAAIIDQNGMLRKVSRSDEFTIINDNLALNKYETFYSRHGDYLGEISCLIIVVLFFVSLLKLITKK